MQIIEIIGEDVKERLWKRGKNKKKAITTPAQEKALKHLNIADPGHKQVFQFFLKNTMVLKIKKLLNPALK